MHRNILIACLLGALPGCLNPDISDEYPLTMEAEALVGDGGEALDEADDADEAADEEALDDELDDEEADDDSGRDAPDRSAPDEGRRGRPRRSFARR